VVLVCLYFFGNMLEGSRNAEINADRAAYETLCLRRSPQSMPKDSLESLPRQRFLRGSFGQELACRKFAGISTDKRASIQDFVSSLADLSVPISRWRHWTASGLTTARLLAFASGAAIRV